MAGAVYGEAPEVGGTAVAKPAEFHDCPVGFVSVDVGEVRTETDGDVGQGRPVRPGVAVQACGEIGLG